MSTIYQAFTNKYHSLASRIVTSVTVSFGGKKLSVNALWDTGATGTNISKEVARDLGLVSTGIVSVHTAGGVIKSNTYLVNILLPNNVMITDAQVCDSEIGNQGLGMLIGMDIISRGDFAISSFNGKTTFSYRIPSKNSFDFVPESNIDNIIASKKSRGKSPVPHKRK